MIRYLIIRFGRMVFFLSVVSFIIFYILHQLGGDPALMQLGIDADLDTIEQHRTELGIDQSIIIQFLEWARSFLTGQGGQSFFYGFDSLTLVNQSLAVTVPLTLASILFASFFGLLCGGVMTYKSRNWLNRFLLFIAHIVIAIPSFWLGMALLIVISVGLGWLPSGNFPGWQVSWQLSVQSLVLPTIALGLPVAAVMALLFRTTVFAVIRQDFIRTARAKGISRFDLWWRHILRHCAIPIVTFIALYSAMILMGAVIVETVFHLPGLGKLLLQALHNRDYPLLQTGLVMILLIIMLIQVVADILLIWIDPRLRSGREVQNLPYYLQA